MKLLFLDISTRGKKKRMTDLDLFLLERYQTKEGYTTANYTPEDEINYARKPIIELIVVIH